MAFDFGNPHDNPELWSDELLLATVPDPSDPTWVLESGGTWDGATGYYSLNQSNPAAGGGRTNPRGLQ